MTSHIRIVWPEKRIVTEEQIATWYSDAVANGEATAGITDPLKQALALDDAGIITVGGKPNPEQQLKEAAPELLRVLRDVVARIGKTPVRMDLSEAHALLKRFEEQS